MIIKTINKGECKIRPKHIVFPINIEGYNDTEFSLHWPELNNCGIHKMGTVLSKTLGDVTLHAIVCYSLQFGWPNNQSDVICDSFNKIKIDNETLYTYLYGTKLIDQLNGANMEEIIFGMYKSNKRIVLQTNYSLASILNYCKKHPIKIYRKQM